MSPLCTLTAKIFTWQVVFGSLEVIYGIICLGLVFLVWKNSRTLLSKLIFLVSTPIFFLILTTFTFVILWFVYGGDDNPPSSHFHDVNAAVKNTCFLDPRRLHCPKTSEEVIAIEPQLLEPETKDSELTYQYYPQTNQYTLIIRPHNMQSSGSRVVIFDPRLSIAQGYGNGLDFYDAEVTGCNSGGKYKLVSPPPFPGPWDAIN